MKNYIYGAGGHGKVVWDAMQKSNLVCDGFVDDVPLAQWIGVKVLMPSALKEKCNIHLAIGSCKVRETIAENLYGVEFLSVYHPSSIVSSRTKIQLGTFLAAGSIIGPDVSIGSHCIINHHAVVDHDCSVGSFCHIAPNVSLGGGVKIGRGVFVGAGAVVLPGLIIEDYAVVGAGAVVTKDVSSRVTVVGNPAHLI